MTLNNFLQNINRRTFLKVASLTGITGLIAPRNLFGSLSTSQLSRVVLVEDGTATSGLSINQASVQVMMERGIKSLTGLNYVGDAWKSLFPGISSSSIIAIKVNCINSYMPTHPEVTYTVVEDLKKMSFGGDPFPENNIIIFDRTDNELSACGYTINKADTGVRCFGTGNNYSDESYDVNGRSEKISKIVTERADYLINISVLKNHGTSGVTLCMKNHYGTCNYPALLHGNNYCDPYIPALNTLAPIRDKQCINICDALLGIYSGGPGGLPQFAANTIIISKDIVAVDYWGREILRDNGCPTLSRAHHIETAAAAPYSLGTNDPLQMEIVNIQNPTPVEKNSWGSIKNLFR